LITEIIFISLWYAKNGNYDNAQVIISGSRFNTNIDWKTRQESFSKITWQVNEPFGTNRDSLLSVLNTKTYINGETANILNSLDGVVLVHHAESGKLLWVNSKIYDIYGYTRDEILHIRADADGDGPHSIHEAFENFRKTAELGVRQIDWKARHKDGHWFWVEVNSSYAEIEGESLIISTIQDIHQRKELIQQLSESEMRFRALHDGLFGGIGIHDKGKVLDCNKGLSDITGYTHEELLCMNGLDLIAPQWRDFVRGKIASGYIGVYEAEGIKKDRTVFPLLISGRNIPYKGKTVRVTEFRDITERKKIIEDLREKEERLRLLMENISDAIFETDIEGHYLYISPSYTRITCWSDEVIGSNALEKIHPDDCRNVAAIIGHALTTRENIVYEYRFRHRTKGYIWIESHCCVYISSDGKPRYLVSSRDISEWKETETLMRESAESYQGLINSVDEAIYFLNEDCVFIDVNDGACRMYGYKREDLVGKTPAAVSAPDLNDLEEVTNAIARAFNGETTRIQFWGMRKSGEIFPKDIRISKGRYFGQDIAIAVAFDITEAKKQERVLIEAKEKAEAMSRAKSNFLANMSHELRTPLIGILGYSDLLLENAGNDEQFKMIEAINESGKRLLSTLNLILNLSKIEADKIEVKYVRADICSVIKELVKTFEGVALKKNIGLEIEVKDYPLYASVDMQMFDSIINNLVNNAIKFTKQGKITVEVFRELEADRAWGVIRVCDTGIGMSPEACNYIFEEFRQASEGLGRAYEGTGLGLTIARKYVDILNGKISVESKPGEGSIFTVKLPCIMENNITKEQHVPPDHESGQTVFPHILLVDDDLTTFGVIKYMTAKLCTIIHAKDAKEAIAAIKKKTYDLVLLDINLGVGLNGFDVLKEIKSMQEYKSVPVVALTAYAMVGDRERFLAAGCDYYLAKPFRKLDLLELIQTALKKQ
jgi:PAS domain S-box-containing protein